MIPKGSADFPRGRGKGQGRCASVTSDVLPLPLTHPLPWRGYPACSRSRMSSRARIARGYAMHGRSRQWHGVEEHG
eukprot:6084431-Pyramimonas_sp.AAC.1